MNMRLFEVMRNRGLKQSQLCHLIRSIGGVPRDEGYLSRIINERIEPNARHKYWIARALGVDEEHIF